MKLSMKLKLYRDRALCSICLYLVGLMHGETFRKHDVIRSLKLLKELKVAALPKRKDRRNAKQ